MSDFLNERFPGRLIECQWSARSPDVTPLDFFVGILNLKFIYCFYKNDKSYEAITTELDNVRVDF